MVKPVGAGMSKGLTVVLALLVLGACWGLTPSLAKLALAGGMRPLGIATVAASIGATILLTVAAAKRDLPRFTMAHWRHYLAGGLIGLTLANLFAFTALQHAPAGLFAVLVPLAAVFSVIFFALAGLDRVTPRRALGTAVGLGGVMLAISPGAVLPDAAMLPWAALMLLTPLCYAAANLLSVKLAVPGSSPLAQAAGTVLGAALSAFVVAALLGHLAWPADSRTALVLLAHGATNALGYLVYFRLLTGAGGVVTSQTSMTITLGGLTYGYLIFNEVPGWLALPAIALIFAGLVLVTSAKVSPKAA